ncbi:MAG: hypothetical protein B6V02_00615 [Thermoprotei archaeon ex4572_64]|nr:MAG: hypothetical protein B6V02_00615 [Thermoprotei archaeon ex4572_64]
MKIRCPKCGYVFDTMYSRAVACAGCSLAVFGDCGYVKCPRCGYEIEMSGSRRFTKITPW